MRHVSLAVGAVAILVMECAPERTSARDRPGTPNRETAYACQKEGTLSYSARPSICVMFNNTATERVRFDVEWTADGVKLTQEAFAGHVECARRVTPQFDPDGTQCVAGSNLMGSRASTQLSGLIDWSGFVDDLLAGEAPINSPAIPREAFLVKDLEFDTDYCFRFKARAADNDVVSEEWSNWACARTAGAPPKPPAPTDLKVAFTAAHWDGRRDSPPVPAHVDFAWSADERYVAYLELADHATPDNTGRRSPIDVLSSSSSVEQRSERSQGYAMRLAPSSRTAVVYFEPAELDALPHRTFWVCAHNISGASCSLGASVPAWHGPIDRPNPDATGMTHPNAGEQDANRPVPTTLPTTTDQTKRRGGFGTQMSTPPGQGNTQGSDEVFRAPR